MVTAHYHAFILTVDIYTVAIYCLPNGGYKVFDSHSRDLVGMAHPYGTCTLIEIDSLVNLVQYFQNLYSNTSNTYEIKGINIIEVQSNSENNNAVYVENGDLGCNDQLVEINRCSCKECCATCISFYAICFSTLKSCSYWTTETVDSIIENGKEFHQKYHCGQHMFISDLPDKLDIGTGHVKVVSGARSQGYLSCNMVSSKQTLKSVILEHNEYSTGFLMWISSYCISCVFQTRARQKLSYVVFAYDDTKPAHVPQVFSDIESVIDLFCDIVQCKFNCVEIKYEIAFFRCLCELSNNERKQIIRKHKSAAENASIQKRRREKYSSMNPEKKQKILSNYAEKYKLMDPERKEEHLSNNAEKYRSMDPEKKEERLSNYAQKYRSMDPGKKKELLSNSAEKYRSMDPEKKEELLSNNAEKYRSMDPEKKEELLSNYAKKYRSMDPEKKEELLSNNAEKYWSLDPEKKEERLSNNAEKYRSMDPEKRKELLSNNAEKYRSMDPEKKEELLSNNMLKNTGQWTQRKENSFFQIMLKSTGQWTQRKKNNVCPSMLKYTGQWTHRKKNNFSLNLNKVTNQWPMEKKLNFLIK